MNERQLLALLALTIIVSLVSFWSGYEAGRAAQKGEKL